jgi:hypothetical protein
MSDKIPFYPAWEIEFRTAMLELDPALLIKRIADAEAAITQRLDTISVDDPGYHTERRAIDDALAQADASSSAKFK